MIIDKKNMVKLQILSNMEKQLAKARGFSNFSTAVFGGLPIVIVMRDFYQFLPIADRLLWGKPQTNKDHNSKTL